MIIVKSLLWWVKYFALLTVPAVLFTLLVLELIFRFVIPAADPPHAYFDSQEQIFRFDVNGPRTGQNTVGNLAQLRADWRINNMGWMSEIDYSSGERDKPLIAIIGDSMVVALQVDRRDSFPSRLRAIVNDEFDVYSFAASGAPLSQYLHVSRYVNRVFDPDILVFNVVHNDFDQSLCDRWRPLGMQCLQVDDEGIQEFGIVPYTPSKIRRLARHSSLVRYLFLNLKLAARFSRSADKPKDPATVSPAASNQQELEARIERALDYILGRISAENPQKTVIFMIDGSRRLIYGGDLVLRRQYELRMSRLLERKTSKYGFPLVDLGDSFADDFAANQQIFDSKQDRVHWNERGHAVSAAALAGRILATAEVRR